jgi:hypothetical protein
MPLNPVTRPPVTIRIGNEIKPFKTDGTFDHREIHWERDQPGPYHEKIFPIAQHKDLYNR